jgi:hypothetical protein
MRNTVTNTGQMLAAVAPRIHYFDDASVACSNLDLAAPGALKAPARNTSETAFQRELRESEELDRARGM